MLVGSIEALLPSLSAGLSGSSATDASSTIGAAAGSRGIRTLVVIKVIALILVDDVLIHRLLIHTLFIFNVEGIGQAESWVVDVLVKHNRAESRCVSALGILSHVSANVWIQVGSSAGLVGHGWYYVALGDDIAAEAIEVLQHSSSRRARV